jgi:hypothetical protein
MSQPPSRGPALRLESLVLALVSLVFIALSGRVQAQVSFFQPPQYSGSGNVFITDFNGDGKPDILTSDGTLNLGNGDGTFKLGTSLSGSAVPVLAVADFNGDGKPDILERGTGTLIVLLGNGDGTFQAPISTPSSGDSSVVAAVDLNGDGKADVVGIFNSSLLVYIGKGDGTFASGVSNNLGAASAANTVLSLGDFNGDRKIDIAVSIAGDQVAGDEIVLLGNGDGTFQAAKTSTGIYYPQYAAVGDFNGDGKLDLAVSSNCNGGCPSDAAYVLLGNGDGTFQTPTVAFPGTGSLAAADLNGDGKLDLVNYAAVVQIYLGNGDGTFSNASNYLPTLANSSSFDIGVADFNLDGKLDIAAGNGVLLGLGTGTFQGIQLGVIPGTPAAAVTGDFDKNDTVDVATISSDTLYILSNNGVGQLTLTHTYGLQQPGYGIVTADFNGDGNLDLAVLGVDSTNEYWSYSIFLGNGDGSFQSPVTYSQNVLAGTTFGPDAIVVADFNGDQRFDLAVAVPEDHSLAVLLGNGDGTFASPIYYYDAGNTTLLVSDFNGDGKLDIAVGSGAVSSSPQTAILFGNGDGTFQPAAFPASLNNFVAQFTGDLNNDGKPDLMSAVQVALGNGDGTFTLLPVLSVQSLGVVDALADLNGDGKLDALVPDLGVLLGNGDGTFGPLIGAPVPSNVLIADMNGDGLPDFVFSWQELGVNGVGVLLNTTQVGPPPPDFQVFASRLSPTPMTAGNSATSTITVTPLNGFAGNVALSCAGLPTGVNCSFDPASITGGSDTSTLTVSTASSLAGGSYPIIVTGVSGSISHIATLTLTVETGTAPDFQISATAASPATVTPGNSATSTVTVAEVNGFNSAVALTCDSGVSGVSCSLNPTSVTPSGSTSPTSTLTLNTTTAAMPGTHSVTIYGTSGSDVHSIGTTLTVQVAPDFTLAAASGSPTSQTINAGQTASFSLALAPTGSFTGTVNLSCAITPTVSPAPTCNLSSSSVQISGSGAQPVTVKVATTAPVTTGTVSYVDFPPGSPLAWTLMLLGSTWLWARNRKRLPALAAPIVVLAIVFSVGCGGGGSPSTHTMPGTPSGTYAVTITASSGSVSQNMALQVVVQ